MFTSTLRADSTLTTYFVIFRSHPEVRQIISCMTSTNVYVGLQTSQLNACNILNMVKSPQAGAIVVFAGTTKNNFAVSPSAFNTQKPNFAGKEVLHLDYEAYEILAERSLDSICSEACRRWGLLGAACYHRLGRVPIGEESMVIAVSAVHRKDGWEAGEWILEKVKCNTEIWKREQYKDGSLWKRNTP